MGTDLTVIRHVVGQVTTISDDGIALVTAMSIKAVRAEAKVPDIRWAEPTDPGVESLEGHAQVLATAVARLPRALKEHPARPRGVGEDRLVYVCSRNLFESIRASIWGLNGRIKGSLRPFMVGLLFWEVKKVRNHLQRAGYPCR